MKKIAYFFLVLIISLPLFAGQGIELNNINATWGRVLPGKLICPPQMTSYGFAVITDAKNLMSFNSDGSLYYEKRITKASSAFFGVLQNDFIALVTANSKRISLINPDGKELWNRTEDFKIIDEPFSGRDGRFFVRGNEILCCYGISGIRKWELETPLQSELPLQELNDGSLIVFLKQLEQGKTKAIRVTPFGEIVEEITFAGEVTKALTTQEGVLLVFTDGSSGLFELKDNKSVHKWLFKKELSKKTNLDFFILSQEKTEVLYVNIKNNLVEIDYINLEDGSIKDSFIIDEGIIPSYGWFNSSGVFIADSKKACFYNNMGRYLWSGNLPSQKSKYNVDWTAFTSDNCFLLFSSDWSIHAFRTAHAPQNKVEELEQKKNDYKNFYTIDTTFLELSLPYPLDKNLLLPERSQNLNKGDYGKLEIQYASQLLSICTAYKNVISTSNFGSRIEKSVFQTDAAGMEILISQLGLFYTSTFCDFTAYFLKNQNDRSILRGLLKGVKENGYDPDGKILESLEYLSHNINEKDESLLIDLCDAITSVCSVMGSQAIDPCGKNCLSVLMYPKYTSTIRDYARSCLKKLVGK